MFSALNSWKLRGSIAVSICCRAVILDKNNKDPGAEAGIPDLRWLALGAIAGLIAAGYGILREDSSAMTLPETAIARVNDIAISRDSYERALARFPAGADEPTEMDGKAQLIESLVNEELLLQRGIELGMAQSDSAVRTAIINSLVASITAEADAASPPDEELQRHLTDNAERFSYTAKIAVEGWQTDDESIAQLFVDKLRNSSEVPVVDTISLIPDLPRALTPVEILADYFGPGIAAAAANMPVGSSAVFARRGRWIVVRVVEKESAVVTDISTIRSRVLLDYRRSLADETLQQFIDDLRSRADIEVALP